MPRQGESKLSITAEDQFSPQICFDLEPGGFEISIAGVFVADVTLQRKFEGESIWRDVHVWDEPSECIGEQTVAETLWRLGVKTGDFSSGPIEVRLAQ